MKTLTLLALALLLPSSAFAGDLISVPDEAIVDGDDSSSGSRFLDFGLEDTDIPDSKDPEVYVRWIKARILAHKKSAMASRAYGIRPAPDVACLHFHDAFGFDEINENEYKLNCFAGNSKSITHVIDYHMKINYIPADCASDQRIRDYFRIPVYLNRQAAQSFWNQLRATCMIQAEPVDPARPIVRSVAVSAEWVNKALQGKEDLRLYVNGSRKSKISGSDTGGGKYKNPLKGGEPVN